MFPLILLLLTFTTLTNTQNANLCPSDSGLVTSARLSFVTNGNQTNSIPQEQTLTFNHTLSQPFNKQPGVILSITSFNSKPTLFLMFSAKPLPMTTMTTLPILLRFFQRYTFWNSIKISYLAEDRSDMEAEYYEIDTRQLGSVGPSKAVEISLPILTPLNIAVAVYFLSGFQLSSLPVNPNSNILTPFEIAVAGKSSNKTNIVLVVSTTSSSQIFSLIISYLAFQNSTQLYKAGLLQFQSATASSLTAPIPLPPQPLALIDGISGFVINNLNTTMSMDVILTSNSFQFNFQPNITYLNYQYFLIPDNSDPCFFCQGNPYQWNNTCVAQCPQGQPTHGKCQSSTPSCPAQEIWNGTHCVLRCTGGRIWNNAASICQCQNNLVWNGNSCISCPSGQSWNNSLNKCSCPDPNQIWTGQSCQNSGCGPNQVMNPFTFQCDCTPGSHKNGSDCIKCTSSQTWNGSHCICSNSQQNSNSCSNCSANMTWDPNSNRCICSNNSYFNGIQCIICTGGRIMDTVNNICTCPQNEVWDGSNCISPCSNPFVYNNGQCVCPSGTVKVNNTCQNTPVCPNGQTWQVNACSSISCTPGYFWNSSACVQYVQACPVNTYWNGLTCITSNIQCPNGSIWNGTYCAPLPSCPVGTYLSGGQCLFFPQLCLPNYSWNGSQCLAVGSATTCSDHQLYNGSACINVNCTSGRIWSSLFSQCICNSSSFWNGLGCISCPKGQVFRSGSCTCQIGFFLVDNLCYSLQQVYCSFISAASWNGTNCVCKAGFQTVGVNCICNGIMVNGSCNICYHRANSVLVNGECMCKQGYYLIFGQCMPFGPPNNTVTSCQPGTLLLNGICVPCSDGCLSCTSQSVCLQCRPEFSYNWATYTCQQICGDGLRFSLPCDDFNNINGDGCSSDCHIEPDYTCYGGSPNSRDTCTMLVPQKMTVNMTGNSHLYGVINVNLKLNFLPSNLSDASLSCTDLCQQILEVAIVAGENSTVSVVSQYFPGTYSFAISFNFAKEPIGIFTIQVKINPGIASIYFPSVYSQDSFLFTINPAFLAMYEPDDYIL